MFGMGNGTKGRGRPRRKWLDEVVETTGLRLQQLKEAVRDRMGWRDVVRVITRGRLNKVTTTITSLLTYLSTYLRVYDWVLCNSCFLNYVALLLSVNI